MLLPIVPHGRKCRGCLIVIELEGGSSNLTCNECGEIVRNIRTDEAPQILIRMAMDEGICSAICPHCGTLNTFTGFTSIEAYICRECGEGVSVGNRV